MHCHTTTPSRRRHRWRLSALGMALVLPGLAAASPALEYGPEAEARFRVRCEAIGAAPRECQALMERLQARLGYAAFLESAGLGPDGFELLAGDLPLPAPTLLARRP